MNKALLLAAVPAAFGLGLGAAWLVAQEARLTLHGWIAITLGVSLTILLAGLLMGLVFFSARHGYDDRPPRQGPDL